jgi:hypothetical protein
MPLDYDKANQLLQYDPSSGIIYWKVANKYSRILEGSVAGCLDKRDGYIRVRVGGMKYLAHRLGWLLHTGYWPKDQLDHIDGVRSNNKLENLRECTNAENQQNSKKRKDNTTGYVGVIWMPKNKKYQATFAGHYLGLYKTAEGAYQAYLDAKIKNHKFNPVPRLSSSIGDAE